MATVGTVVRGCVATVLVSGFGAGCVRVLSEERRAVFKALASGVALSTAFLLLDTARAKGGQRGLVGMLLGALLTKLSRRALLETQHRGAILLLLRHCCMDGLCMGAGFGAGSRVGGLTALGVCVRRAVRQSSTGEWLASLALVPLFAIAGFLAASALQLGLGAGFLLGCSLFELIPESLASTSTDLFAAGVLVGIMIFEGFHVGVEWAALNPKPAAAVFQALAWSCVAGGATAVGGCVVFVTPRLSKRVDALLLGFAAGVMIALSVVDIILPNLRNGPTVLAAVCLGVAAVQGLRRLLRDFAPGDHHLELAFAHSPKKQNPDVEEDEDEDARASQNRTAALVTLALAAHNAPEGLAVGIAAHSEPRRAALMALAIAMHNVPEGVAVASSVYLACKSKRVAFMTAAATGLVEPISALLSAALLAPLITEAFVETALCFVAGVMIAVSLQELLPHAYKAHAKFCGIGYVVGWCTMHRGLQIVKTL